MMVGSSPAPISYDNSDTYDQPSWSRANVSFQKKNERRRAERRRSLSCGSAIGKTTKEMRVRKTSQKSVNCSRSQTCKSVSNDKARVDDSQNYFEIICDQSVGSVSTISMTNSIATKNKRTLSNGRIPNSLRQISTTENKSSKINLSLFGDLNLEQKECLLKISNKYAGLLEEMGSYYELLEKYNKMKEQNENSISELSNAMHEFSKERKAMNEEMTSMKSQLKRLEGLEERNKELEDEVISLKSELSAADSNTRKCSDKTENVSNAEQKEIDPVVEQNSTDETSSLTNTNETKENMEIIQLKHRNKNLENEIIDLKLQMAQSLSMEDWHEMKLREMTNQLLHLQNGLLNENDAEDNKSKKGLQVDENKSKKVSQVDEKSRRGSQDSDNRLRRGMLFVSLGRGRFNARSQQKVDVEAEDTIEPHLEEKADQ